MDKKTKTYSVCGLTFDEPGLLSFCLEKLNAPSTPDWERETWRFILIWFSPEETIEVETSGSTGKPKKILLQKKYMKASALATLSFFALKPGSSVLLCLPVKFIAGKMMVVRALTGGLDLLFVKPTANPDLSKFNKIDFSAMTPMQVDGMLEEPNGKEDLEKIEKLIVGGSFISSSLENKLGGLKNQVWQTYGMTETNSNIALRKLTNSNVAGSYTALRGVNLVKDANNCLVIDTNHLGVKQLVTNDLVEFDNKGNFIILGRVDHVVNSGAVKLHPELIEQKLESVIDKPFFLGGIPDEKLGERLVLFIESDELNEKNLSSLRQEIKHCLSGFEIPKEIIFQKKFKRTPSGKIIRKK